MNKYKVFPNAKINLGLNVFEKDKSNYHTLDTIMLPINLTDELEISILPKKGSLNIECSDLKVPRDKRNILYKVYKKFYEIIKKEELEINIYLKKNIPTEAGLGGGSSDAAAFLKILNEYYKNYLKKDELIKFAFEIGSDVPFFLENKSSRISGKGEKTKIIKSIFEENIVLVKPNFGVSTKLAYENFDNLKNVKYSDLDEIERGLIENNKNLIEKNIENSLEQAMAEDKNITMLKNSLKPLLPNNKFFMTGSGSTFFSFISENEKNFVEARLKTFLDDVKIFICKIKK